MCGSNRRYRRRETAHPPSLQSALGGLQECHHPPYPARKREKSQPQYSYCEFRIRHEGPNRTYSVRRVLRSHSGAVKKETDGGGLLSLPFTEGIHEFLQLSRPLDLEENLIVVIGDLDVEVLDSASWGLASLWCIGHGCGVSCECGGEKRILAWEESVTFR